MEPVILRPELPSDADFLFNLYADTRERELSPVAWSVEQKEAFLRQQFQLQSHHYKTYHPKGSFDIVVQAGEAIGRLYVDREFDQLYIIDIALLSGRCGQGIGSMLMMRLLAEAEEAGLPVNIHVEVNNPAITFYHRLGFSVVAQEGLHILMTYGGAQAKAVS